MEPHPSDPNGDPSQLVIAHVLTEWTRTDDGNHTRLGVECAANGWPARITDAVDQPGEEIRSGHGIVVELACSPATLAIIEATGNYLILDRSSADADGELGQLEKEQLSQHPAIAPELKAELSRLPANATKRTVRQLLCDRFRQPGLS